MRALLVVAAVLGALVLPAGAQADGLYVSSQKNSTLADGGITGLIGLTDGGGETTAVDTGGFRITGTGAGPIVYSSGVIKQYNGAGGYSTLVPSAGSNIRSMTVTGRGLLVADGGTLKLRSDSALVPALPAGNTTLPGGKLPGSDLWISLTTLPDGHVLGWAFNNGYGALYEINLSTGAVSYQDYSQSASATDPFLDNRNSVGQQQYSAPIQNSGGLSADGKGGVWVAAAGIAGPGQDSQGNQIYYAPPGTLSFSPLPGGTYANPQITSTGTGEAYVTNTFVTPPFTTDIYKVTSSGTATKVTSASGNLVNSRVDSLAVDRCYTSCSVTSPGVGGGGAKPLPPATGASPGTGKGAAGTTSSPLKSASKSLVLGKKGFSFKLTCKSACSVTVSGKLVFAKAKKKKGKKASAATSDSVGKAKATLKAGKAKTLLLKLSKSQRAKIKKALKKKQKVSAKLKVVITPKGARSSAKSLTLKVK